MKCTKFKIVISVCAAMVPMFSYAQTSSDSWQFEITPYLWAAGLSGSARIGPNTPEIKLDANFSDVWSHLNIAGMGSFEARKGRWGIMTDLIYLDLSKTSEPLLDGALGTARFKLKQTLFQPMVAYRLYDSSVVPVDLVVGARFTHLDGTISLSQSFLLPQGIRRSDSANWTDAIFGARASYAFAEKWSLMAAADVGAGDTKHSWEWLAGVDYHISDKISAKMGYRVISMDYNNTGLRYNIKTSGIFAGVGIKF